MKKEQEKEEGQLRELSLPSFALRLPSLISRHKRYQVRENGVIALTYDLWYEAEVEIRRKESMMAVRGEGEEVLLKLGRSSSWEGPSSPPPPFRTFFLEDR